MFSMHKLYEVNTYKAGRFRETTQRVSITFGIREL